MSTSSASIIQSWQEISAATLVHSLWQGAIIVLTMWFLRLFIYQNNRKRHLLSFFALVTLVACNIFTFILLWNQKSISIYTISNFSHWLNNPAILLRINQLWLLGTFIFLLRFVFSHFYMQRLIQRSQPLQCKIWTNLFEQIKSDYKIHKSILLLHTEKIGSAFITGVLKPVIIIPTAWINQLSEQEAECILAHELSHVYNKDPWINLFMNIIEIIFYFNPAVHILISHLKLDRELVADSSVCNYLKTPIQYAKLILKIEETSGFIPAFSLPFFKQKNQLKKRIESVLNLKSRKDDVHHSITISLMVLIFLFINNTPVNNSISNTPSSSSQTICSTPVNNHSFSISCNNSFDHSKVQRIANKKSKTIIKNDNIESSASEFNADNLSYIEAGNQDIFKEIEQHISMESSLPDKIFVNFNSTTIDTIYSLNGSSKIISRQIKCYAPSESKTYIIIRTNVEQELKEQEDDIPESGINYHKILQLN